MHLLKLNHLTIIFSLFTLTLFANQNQEYSLFTTENDFEERSITQSSLHFRHANSISLGPEFYRVNRNREGGTKQKGNSIGVRATYDRIQRYKYYLGAQLFCGTGILHGHNSTGDKIRSRLTEQQIEGNLGYTFQMKCFPHVSFTPFAGYGYFKETNNFSPPTPLSIKFTTQFKYISFGFLSSVYVLPCLTAGINARFKYPWQTRCKVTNDPDYDTINLMVEDKLHYRIELPLTYFGCFFISHLEMAFIPFFEQRLYGGRENYPFDFFKTKFKIFGANVQLIYRF